MKKFIVFTTIQQPTPGVKAWCALKDWKVIGIGDRKTPLPWVQENCIFLTDGQQEKEQNAFIKALPWNHYTRKMVGYAWAMTLGADVIVDVDDDNIPKEDWSLLPFDGRYLVTNKGEFVNVYTFFTAAPIWPRGFPLRRVLQESATTLDPKDAKIGVWQMLVDKDPDVDAIHRLTWRWGDSYFDNRPPVVLGFGSTCPFNSQSTAWRKELFPLLYLPSVNFRFTDILRSLVAQPIMWQLGYHVGFTGPTVVQERNLHDPLADFESEIPMYLHSERIPAIVEEATKSEKTIFDKLWAAYVALLNEKIVDQKEMQRLGLWIKEFER